MSNNNNMDNWINALREATSTPGKEYISLDGVVFITIENSVLADDYICYKLPAPDSMIYVKEKSEIVNICKEERLRIIFKGDFDTVFNK